MWPSKPENRATAWLQLGSGDMAALFELPMPPLSEWLEHTYELVPAGHELSGVNWDVTAADLLSSPIADRVQRSAPVPGEPGFVGNGRSRTGSGSGAVVAQEE
ncbi:SsgA family sporulation/cell division regulator [Streptomyces sp. NPDC059568]|uniref:SsgA family sporulation/cell division regulator n=1 Tax=unclassified Streptomyces TaxID=2593676 RepID=UPI00365D16FD